MNDVIEIGMRYIGIGIVGRQQLIDYYNEHCLPLVDPKRRYRMSLNDDWCAMFTSVVAHMAGATPETFPFEVSVYYQYMGAKRLGMVDDSPRFLRRGDMVVYDWGIRGGYNHVGFVESTLGDRINVLEGNYKGTVGIRNVARSSPSLQAFILLDRQPPQGDIDRLYELAHRVLRGEFGNGRERMEALGDDYYPVQEIINRMA